MSCSLLIPSLIVFIVVISGCSKSSPPNSSAILFQSHDSATYIQSPDTIDYAFDEETVDNDIETYFLVIADTSLSYDSLHTKMRELNRLLKIPIDTLGRGYDRSKNLISLPETDEDEMYAGEYFPRRFPSESVSLEYLSFYQKAAGTETIALMAGIYETEKSADSALRVLNQYGMSGFIIKADIYVGCMH